MIRYFFLTTLCLLGVVVAYSQPQEERSVSYEVPQEYEIGGITIKGVQHLDPKVLKSIAGLKVGETIKIPGDDISNAIQDLWRQGLFTNVKIYATKFIGDKVFLQYKLKERPRLSRYQIRGVKKNKAEDVREKLDLVKGRVVTENTKVTARNTIKDFFKEKGYLQTRVNIIERPDTILNNSVMLVFKVDKNDKVKIADIEIKGNEKVSSRKIKKLMGNTNEKVHVDFGEIFSPKKALPDSGKIKPLQAAGNISPITAYKNAANHANFNIFSSSKFIQDQYEKDKNKIISHYRSKGFRDATIKSDSVYMTDNDDLQITMNIDEGNRYRFRNIAWEGNTKYSDEQLNSILSIEKGEIYDQSKLQTRLQMNRKGPDVSSIYMDNGYLFFQATPEEVKVVNDSIDLKINIYEGPQATIDEITITGNTKTNERVIRRELHTIPGRKFSRSDLIRSQRQIANLGFFDPQKTQVTPVPDPKSGTVDIKYDVAEKPSDQLELSAGWGGAGRGLVGTLGVKFTNFSLRNITNFDTWTPLPSGDGQQFSLRVQANGRQFQSYNMSFTEPWLGGTKPNSLSVSLFRSRFANLGRNNEDVRGSLITNGGSISFGKRLKWPDDYFTLQTQLSFKSFVLDNWTTSQFLISDGVSNNFSIKETISRNSVDKRIYPTRGSKVSLSVELTPPYSLFSDKDYEQLRENQEYDELFNWVEFHKWRFDAEWYTPITDKLIIKTQTKFGFLGKYNGDIGISPFERFELGGDGISNTTFYGRDIISMRGYDVITPSLGAPIYDKLTVELRYPFSTNPNSTIFALAFLEGGNAWNKFDNFEPFDLRRSAGFGVRVFLPMFGMLGFDYGIGFDKDVGNTTGFNDYLNRHGQFNIILGFQPE